MALFDDAKERCNITWSETATDKKIQNLLDESTAKMNDLLGSNSAHPVNYETDLMAKDLLLNLVLYKWNEEPEKFRPNYQADINECRRNYDVKNFEDTETSGS